MTALGNRQKKGSLGTLASKNPYGTGLWEVEFTPRDLAVAANAIEMYRLALTGPAGSRLQMFVGQTFYDTTPNGDLNSWDPSNPAVIRGGESLYLYWNVATGSAPFVTIWIRTASAF